MVWHKFCTGTKFSLWTLFALQIVFIGIYWLFQQGFNAENTYSTNKYERASRVNFIQKIHRKHIIKPPDVGMNISSTPQMPPADNNPPLQQSQNKIAIGKISLKSTSNFSADFIVFTESGEDFKDNLTCFRQGTKFNSIVYTDIEQKKNMRECRCQPEWHGKDCGQPEVVWRALMTSKVPLGVVTKARQPAHKIIYMITGHFLSLELLEIQILELENSVDFFILCQKSNFQQQQHKENNRYTLKSRLKIKFSTDLMDRFLIITNNNRSQSKINQIKNINYCSPKLVYKEFQMKVSDIENTIKPDDIFIFSYDDEILNRKAVKYFKYYNDTPQRGVIRFRLKYNVYGFYWQHPESTRLGSALCSIQQLEDHFKSDPERMFNVKKPSMIIGDLNHIGGWYCRYCYQPSEIIEKLTAESTTGLSQKYQINFPKSNKNGQIDVSYIQNLIASGLFVDGKLGLNKLHRFSDKYYAPEYVEHNGWKFDNILINLFLSFNDDDEYGN